MVDPFLDLLSRSGDLSLYGLAAVTVAWAIRRMLQTDTRERSIFDRQQAELAALKADVEACQEEREAHRVRANRCEADAAMWKARAVANGWEDDGETGE